MEKELLIRLTSHGRDTVTSSPELLNRAQQIEVAVDQRAGDKAGATLATGSRLTRRRGGPPGIDG